MDKLIYFPQDLGDHPNQHRWRAFYDWSYCFDTQKEFLTIRLQAFPVVRKTPQAAWIWTYPLELKKGTAEFTWDWRVFDSDDCRLVYDSSASAWAKTTRAEALTSIAVRHHRWAIKLAREIEKFKEAAKLCKELIPDKRHLTNEALNIYNKEVHK